MRGIKKYNQAKLPLITDEYNKYVPVVVWTNHIIFIISLNFVLLEPLVEPTFGIF
jgi:hypothetical protein